MTGWPSACRRQGSAPFSEDHAADSPGASPSRPPDVAQQNPPPQTAGAPPPETVAAAGTACPAMSLPEAIAMAFRLQPRLRVYLEGVEQAAANRSRLRRSCPLRPRHIMWAA